MTSKRKPFNELSPAEVERLALLAEEAGEVIQAIGKILRHGYESRHPDLTVTNREMLQEELGDLRHAVTRLASSGDIDWASIMKHEEQKGERVVQYLHHQGDEL